MTREDGLTDFEHLRAVTEYLRPGEKPARYYTFGVAKNRARRLTAVDIQARHDYYLKMGWTPLRVHMRDGCPYAMRNSDRRLIADDWKLVTCKICIEGMEL